MSNQLYLYYVDLKYNRELSNADANVMTISPQIGKQDKPFIGVLVLINGKEYCAPLTSRKDKHNTLSSNNFDYLKITERHNGKDKLIAIINFNNMIPVHSSVIRKIDMKIRPDDTQEEKARKHLLGSELNFCRSHADMIQKRAQKTYDMIVSGKANASLKKRCCDFLLLEDILQRWLEKHKP